MRPPDALLDRLYHRLVRALRDTGGGDLARPFTVGELTATLVPYRAFRNELGAETLQDYEHGVLLLLAGDGRRLSCDEATVALVARELASPDPDTSLVRRIASAEVRVTSPDSAASLAQLPTPDTGRTITPPATMGLVAGTPRATPPSAATTAAPAPAAPYVAPVLVEARDAAGLRPSAADVASALERLRAMQAEGVATPPSSASVPAATVSATAAAPTKATSATSATNATNATTATATPAAFVPFVPPGPAAMPPAEPPRPAGEPIDFRGMRHAPVDIGGTMLLFGLIARDLGLGVEAVTRGFPRADVVRRLPSGQLQRLRTDFELESGDFRDAGRDAGAIDLLVCWRDTWPDRPARLQVLELRRVVQHLASRG